MIQQEFKVMNWLRKVRDKQSQDMLNKSWDEIHKETQEAAKRMTKRIDEIRKQNNPNIP